MAEVSGSGGGFMAFMRKRPLLRALRNWRRRHLHPFSLAIHLVGIPMTVVGIVLLFAWPWSEWYWGCGLFVLGYALQYLGHLVEGNEMGEWVALKRLFGLPGKPDSPLDKG